MKELNELRLDGHMLILDGDRVMSSVIPSGYGDLENDVLVKGESVIEGSVYARKFQIVKGPFEQKGAMMVRDILSEDIRNTEKSVFRKAVACTRSVEMVSGGFKYFCADLNAQKISLKNAVIAANLFGENITLENCVVLGGVFATKSASIDRCVVGTFSSPDVGLKGTNYTLLPSVFSIEPIVAAPDVRLINLSLADWSSLMQGKEELPRSGAVEMDLQNDMQTVTLKDEDGNALLWRSYSVAAKVLSADLLDFKKLQNHFLFSTGVLGEQMVKQYFLTPGLPLDIQSISAFFYKILHGEIVPRTLDGKFSFAEIKEYYTE